MQRSTITTLKRLIVLLCTLFPFLLSVVVAYIVTFGDWEELGWLDHSNQYFQLPRFCHLGLGVVGILLTLALFLIVVRSLDQLNCKNRTIIKVAVVYGISLGVRLLTLYLLRNRFVEIVPFSDFEQSWQLACGDLTSLPYKSLFASWMNFACVELFFVRLFGADYFLFLLFNCFISSISSPLIYWICRIAFAEHSSCEKYSLIAALSYSLYFPSILFACYSAPDVYTVPLCLLAVLMLLYSENAVKKCKYPRALLFIILAGFVLGLSASLKPFGVVIIIAYGIHLLISGIDSDSLFSCLKKIGVSVLSIALLCCAYVFTKSVVLEVTEREFNLELDYSTATPHYILVGLNNEGEGQIHIGTQSRTYYLNILDNGMSVEEARVIAYDQIRTDWETDDNIICNLLLPKLVWAWQDDVRPLYYAYWMNDAETIESELNSDEFDSYAFVLQAAYLQLISLGLIGTIFAFKEEHLYSRIVFVQMIIIGYFFITIVSEAQSRYKYVIIPLLCVMASIGFCQLYEILWGRLSKAKNSPIIRIDNGGAK